LEQPLAGGDDAAIYDFLASQPVADQAEHVAWLAGRIAFFQGRLVAAACFFDNGKAPSSLLDIEALGMTLLASREVSGYLVRSYDQLRFPSQQLQSAQACLTASEQFPAEHLGEESMPLFLLLALPVPKVKVSIQDRLYRINSAIAGLTSKSSNPRAWQPARPLPEAVELGRASWLGQRQPGPPTDVGPMAPWDYAVRYPDGTVLFGDCLFNPWSELNRVLSNK
jgi:hypothetical protein